MMNSTSHLLEESWCHSSVVWHTSQHHPKVRFSVRKPSLMQRINLNDRVRTLLLRYDFLKAGDTADQLEASLSELLSQELYVEWGLGEVTGLTIDGEPATPQLLLEKGPESLVIEIVEAVQRELTLTEQERKNF